MFPESGWDYGILAAEVSSFLSEPLPSAIVYLVLGMALFLMFLRLLSHVAGRD